MINGLQLLKDSMMDYGMAVNEDRAIPDGVTGLKPIHLKILYEMWIDKIRQSGKYHKNAKMVGSVISRFSEHGDTSAYEALARLSQPWTMLYPLIDFHGNNGSQFGDGPAAYRYTESKLAALAEDGFLNHLDDSLPEKYWGLNFLEEEPEPLTFPSVFPGFLCSPNTGIGYGVASTTLSFNLSDVYDMVNAYLFEEDIPIKQYDFPTGGTIINPSIMKDIYVQGKGTVTIEGTYTVKDNIITFTEVPWGVEIDKILDSLQKLVQVEDSGIQEVLNNCGNSLIKIDIIVKPGHNVEQVLDYIFAKTDLRKNHSVNMNALVNGKPKALNIYDAIQLYIEHNLECLQTKYKNEKEKLEHRLMILEGLLKAILKIDEVINIIRKKDNPKEELKKFLNINEEQVNAILKMTLSRLSHLEEQKLLQEKKEKEQRLAEVIIILANDNQEQEKELLVNLNTLVKKYAAPRKTKVEEKIIKKIAPKKKVEAPPQEVIINFTETGYLQKIPVASARNVKGISTFKCMTNDMVLLFSSFGKVYRLQAKDIKECSSKDKGDACGALLKLDKNEKILNVFSSIIDEKHPYIAFFTKNGLVKKSNKIIYLGTTRNLNGLQATKVLENDIVIAIYETNGDIAKVTSSDGYVLYFNMDEVRETGKTARGVKSINLNADATVVKAEIVNSTNSLGKRGAKGKKIDK